MSERNKSVFGIFKSRMDCESAVESLKSEGFATSDISVLLPESSGGPHEFAHSKGSKAPEGAATGAGTGAIIGGAFGLLAGIGALAIPGAGAFIAAGPIMSVLAGLGLGGAVGGVSGALIGMGVPEYEAKRYEGSVKNGGILLSVHTDTADLRAKAKRILEVSGATDIASGTEAKGEAKIPYSQRLDMNKQGPNSKTF